MSKLNFSALATFTESLKSLDSQILRNRIAMEVAPLLTDLGKGTFGQSQNAYGVPWAPGEEGQIVTLVDTGALRRHIEYRAIGSKLRVAIGVKYAKYQIGKRPVYPAQTKPLPPSYAKAIQTVTEEMIEDWLK